MWENEFWSLPLKKTEVISGNAEIVRTAYFALDTYLL